MLVLGCPCPAQPTTPSSGMCGSGAGSSCGSPSQLGTAFPYKAGPRGEEPGSGRPPFLPRGRRVGPSQLRAHQWRARGGEAAGPGWAWGRGTEMGSGLLVLSSQLRGGGGRKCVRQLLLLFLLQNAFSPPSSQTLLLMAGEAPRIAWKPSLAFPVENDRVCGPPEDSGWWASLETHLHLLNSRG